MGCTRGKPQPVSGSGTGYQSLWGKRIATCIPHSPSNRSVADSATDPAPLVCAGYLAVWSGLFDVSDPNADYNTILFLLFKDRTWLLVIVAVLAATMSTSAVDSIQNAITDSVGATLVRPFFKRADITWIRALVVLLNIPPVVVSLKVSASHRTGHAAH